MGVVDQTDLSRARIRFLEPSFDVDAELEHFLRTGALRSQEGKREEDGGALEHKPAVCGDVAAGWPELLAESPAAQSPATSLATTFSGSEEERREEDWGELEHRLAVYGDGAAGRPELLAESPAAQSPATSLVTTPNGTGCCEPHVQESDGSPPEVSDSEGEDPVPESFPAEGSGGGEAMHHDARQCADPEELGPRRMVKARRHTQREERSPPTPASVQASEEEDLCAWTSMRKRKAIHALIDCKRARVDSGLFILFLNRQRSDLDDGRGVAWGRRWFDKMKKTGGGRWVEWMAGGSVD
jgi:hypothetical protein